MSKNLQMQKPQSNTNSYLLPFETVFEMGMIYRIEIYESFSTAFNALERAIVVINFLATANNGPDTREAMKNASGHLLVSLNDLSIVCRQARKKNFTLSPEAESKLAAFCNDLHKNVQDYLVSKTDDAQVVLRQFLKNTGNGPIQELFREAKKIDRRGRPNDEVKLYIGQLASKYPDPGQRHRHKLGEAVYDDLMAIPPHVITKEQKEAITKLERFMNAGKQRDLGIYISGALKLAEDED